MNLGISWHITMPQIGVLPVKMGFEICIIYRLVGY